MATRICKTCGVTKGLMDFYSHTRGGLMGECKVSRSDFHADKAKIFRRVEEQGVGLHRYYAAPKGVLTPEDMPDGWGLLEITEHHVRVRKQPETKHANKTAEVSMLVSAIRRLELAATVFVRHEDLAESPNGLR